MFHSLLKCIKHTVLSFLPVFYKSMFVLLWFISDWFGSRLWTMWRICFWKACSENEWGKYESQGFCKCGWTLLRSTHVSQSGLIHCVHQNSMADGQRDILVQFGPLTRTQMQWSTVKSHPIHSNDTIRSLTRTVWLVCISQTNAHTWRTEHTHIISLSCSLCWI